MKYKFKVLKHKTLQDTWGYPNTYSDITEPEIYHTHSPSHLLGEDTTIELLKSYYQFESLILNQLDDYELIDVEVIIK